MSIDYKNVPSHTLVSLILEDDGEHDRELMIIELVERYSTSRCLLAEVLKAVEFDILNEIDVDNNDIVDTIEMKTFCHRILIDDEISDPKHYRKVILSLMNCSENDSVMFLINSIGGDMFTPIDIVTGKQIGRAHV